MQFIIGSGKEDNEFPFFPCHVCCGLVNEGRYTLKRATHLTIPSPNPERAPHRPATVCEIQREKRKPIQLNRNDTEIETK